MHVLENTLHSNEKRKGSKWNRIDSLEGWGFKDRRERGSKHWKGKKNQTLQMFNLGDRATFILKDTFPQIKILLSSRIQPCLHSQLTSFFSEHPRNPARVGQPAWCPCSPPLISDSHPFGVLHGTEHLGSATHKQEIRWTDTWLPKRETGCINILQFHYCIKLWESQ